MDRDVHPGLPGHTKRSPGSDSGEPACPVHNIGPMPFLQTERLIARPAAAGERLSGSFAGHVSLQGTTGNAPMLPGSCISGLVEQDKGRLFIRHSCRHAVRPFRVRNHRTYSLSGLISSLRVTARVFLGLQPSCGKPSQKPLTILVRKRHDHTDGLPESDSGIRGIRTYSNMPRLL